jgi:chromosome segregation ATPase
LAAFEYLNRAEERLSTLQKLKIDLTEKQTSIRLKLAEVEDNLRKESIDRSVALRGTTDAEALREIGRQALNREKIELNSLLNEIEESITQTDREVRETISFLYRIRHRIFPAIEKEIEDL